MRKQLHSGREVLPEMRRRIARRDYPPQTVIPETAPPVPSVTEPQPTAPAAQAPVSPQASVPPQASAPQAPTTPQAQATPTQGAAPVNININTEAVSGFAQKVQAQFMAWTLQTKAYAVGCLFLVLGSLLGPWFKLDDLASLLSLPTSGNLFTEYSLVAEFLESSSATLAVIAIILLVLACCAALILGLKCLVDNKTQQAEKLISMALCALLIIYIVHSIFLAVELSGTILGYDISVGRGSYFVYFEMLIAAAGISNWLNLKRAGKPLFEPSNQ